MTKKNGVQIYRELAGLSQRELARRIRCSPPQIGRLETGARELTKEWAERVGKALGRSAEEIMFPDSTKAPGARFRDIHDMGMTPGEQAHPSLSVSVDLLKLLRRSSTEHTLESMLAEYDLPGNVARKGDVLIIDQDVTKVTVPGLYGLRIAGVIQWRYLSPATTGGIRVLSDSDSANSETVQESDLSIVGRAILRISAI